MEKVRLGDVCDTCLGKMLDAEKNKGDYKPYLANVNVRWGEFDLSNLPEMRFEADESERYRLKRGDLVVCEGGEPGRCAIWREQLPEMRIQKALHRVRPNPSRLDVEFLYYWLRLYGKSGKLSGYFTGSTIKHLPGDKLKEIEIELPPLDEQKAIAKVLSDIDAKIANNNSICADLEAMAKLLYDYWFVQFDFPDENGKPYKSSGGKMVWNEKLKCEIPEGWEVCNLYRIADYINGLACQKFRPISSNHQLPVIKISEMHNGITQNTEFVRDDINSKYIVDDGDILFSWSASLEICRWIGGKGGLNQHIFKVVPKVPSQNYVYFQLSSYIVNFIRIAEIRKTTMGHITSDHLAQSAVVIPPDNLLRRFQVATVAFSDAIINTSQESRHLASLRDFLLPMLMNGQVKVG